MKRYLAAIGLIAASAVYVISQHLQGSDEDSVVVTAQNTSTTTDASSSVSQPAYSTNGSTASGGTSSSGSSSATNSGSGSTDTKTGGYKDGTYTGSAANAFYGYVQVQAVVSGGKLSAVNILQYPNDRSTSRFINEQALPYLEQEAISAQSAKVNTVSGASDTSGAFRESLSSALAQAA